MGGIARKKRLTGDQNTRHVLVATRNDDHAVEVVTARSGFDLVGYQVAGLERVGHSTGAHANAVADADGSKLIANDA